MTVGVRLTLAALALGLYVGLLTLVWTKAVPLDKPAYDPQVTERERED